MFAPPGEYQSVTRGELTDGVEVEVEVDINIITTNATLHYYYSTAVVLGPGVDIALYL